jgi:hypothetical protein
MARPKQPRKPDKVEIEPGAEKRLANILKRALNTPPPRHQTSDEPKPKPAKHRE